MAVVSVWIVLHAAFYDTFLLHDSWIHIFPIVFNVSRDVTCSGLPDWLTMLDTGAPSAIYVVSASLTHLVRLPVLYLMGCLGLEVPAAAYLYKLQIYVSYLGFGLGMYVLGRALYERRESAVYLLAATLFTGICLDSAHSDQVVSMVFWVPWIATCLACFWRYREKPLGAAFLCGAVLFASVELLDQYPHFTMLALSTAIFVALALQRGELVFSIARHWKWFWPALLVLVVTGMQLLVVKEGIADYRPSLRGELVVDPGNFGETGFGQPTAFLGALFPLSMLAAHNSLLAGLSAWFAKVGHSGTTGFMYQFDVLFFHVGVLPFFLFLAFLCGVKERRIRLGWSIFGLLMLLYALQQSRLYFVLHHLPFFNVFRSYGLYLVYAVFAFLVMSGYGLDLMLRSREGERRQILSRSLQWLQLCALLVALAFVWLLTLTPGRMTLLGNIKWYLAIDIALLVLGPALVLWLQRRRVSDQSMALAIVAALIVGQSAYAAGVYRILGSSYDGFMARMGLDSEDKTLLPADIASDAARLKRKECALYTQCYLSLRPSASLRTDLEGSFLRSRDSVLYQQGASDATVRALLGVSHPIFWSSLRLREFSDRAMLAQTLGRYERAVGNALREATYVPTPTLGELAAGGTRSSPPSLVALRSEQNGYKVEYDSASDFYLNAAITYDRGWKAFIGDQNIPVARGYFNSIFARVPAGHHTVEFRYERLSSKLFFASRYLMLFAAVAAMALLAIWCLLPARRAPAAAF
jgi:hypothetical protein